MHHVATQCTTLQHSAPRCKAALAGRHGQVDDDGLAVRSGPRHHACAPRALPQARPGARRPASARAALPRDAARCNTAPPRDGARSLTHPPAGARARTPQLGLSLRRRPGRRRVLCAPIRSRWRARLAVVRRALRTLLQRWHEATRTHARTHPCTQAHTHHTRALPRTRHARRQTRARTPSGAASCWR